MKLEIGKQYTTQYGIITYCGLFEIPFVCEKCGKQRQRVHEFCRNWGDYQKGYAGDWLHFGSECVNILEVAKCTRKK